MTKDEAIERLNKLIVEEASKGNNESVTQLVKARQALLDSTATSATDFSS